MAGSTTKLKKNRRSLSGIVSVTVLTKPYPCPGKCIFCPNDVRMPKSYISSEPGSQRALDNKFDPYLQVFNRLVAINNNGHSVSKVELIVLGGTWTFYPEDYRIWFVTRCFDALNDFDPALSVQLSSSQMELPFKENESSENSIYNHVVAKVARDLNYNTTLNQLKDSHKTNESAKARCVGFSIETRPDELTVEVITELRKLGVTKVQLGVQALDNSILNSNKRGHTVEQTLEAFNLLRSAGFKIQIHWMPNLLGSNPQKDLEMYLELFTNPLYRPDEVKIYPCSLVPKTELEEFHNRKLWWPYDSTTMLNLVSDMLINTPRYCRISRVVRDIPKQEMTAGNFETNLRQDAEFSIISKGATLQEIRYREIRDSDVDLNSPYIKITEYETSVGKEAFIEYVDLHDKLYGFLRLSLPSDDLFIEELQGSAVIREIHVYGRSTEIGKSTNDSVQHKGLGANLILNAIDIAKESGFSKLSVISAVGTRVYYRKQHFADGDLYQHMFL